MQLPKIEASDANKWKVGCIANAASWFLAPIVKTVSGAFAGWVVGVFFGTPILLICSQIGIHDVSVLQIGLFLGFVAGFFK